MRGGALQCLIKQSLTPNRSLMQRYLIPTVSAPVPAVAVFLPPLSVTPRTTRLLPRTVAFRSYSQLSSPILTHPGERVLHDEDRHYRDDVSGVLLPSVTTILDATRPAGSREALRRWRVREIKKRGAQGFADMQRNTTDTGTQLHDMIEAHLRGETPEIPPHPEVLSRMWTSSQAIIGDISEPAALESAVLSAQFGYAGTVDCIAKYKGVDMVIDWKTTEKPKRTLSDCYDYPLQLAAYHRGIIDDNVRYPQWQSDQDLTCLLVFLRRDGSPANVIHLDSDQIKRQFAKFQLRLAEFTDRANPFGQSEALLEDLRRNPILGGGGGKNSSANNSGNNNNARSRARYHVMLQEEQHFMIAARFDSKCGECGHKLVQGKGLVVKQGRAWRCTSCALGLSEEEALERATLLS